MKTYLLGDHHANYDDLLSSIRQKGFRDARLIHVGDGEEGYPSWWTADTAERLDREFAALGIEYLSIRGNHANPHVFDGSVMLPHFKLVPDYTRLEINGQSWLFIGGAVSINRIDRQEGINWWPEETMVLREDLAQPADVLVTHAGPTMAIQTENAMVRCYARFEESIGSDSLVQELIDEQHRHDRLFDLVKPKHWYYGHYHHSDTRTHQGCTIRQLDCGELALHAPPA